jgi:membrane protein
MKTVNGGVQGLLDSPRVQALRERMDRFAESAPGRYWRRLSTADFLNSSFAFAALGVISVFPFIAVTSAAFGGDVREVIAARMGLNAEATRDLDSLFATGSQAVATLTWVSTVILVAGAMGMASTLQTWYHRIYDQTPPRQMLKALAYQAAGVAALSFYVSFQVWLFDQVRPVGGRALELVVTFGLATLFWWVSAYMLLFRQVGLWRILPAGVATGACLTGLGAVSSVVFSDQITSGHRSYGPAGVVIALISFLVGFGVCLHAGAVFGRMWNEWRDERVAVADG